MVHFIFEFCSYIYNILSDYTIHCHSCRMGPLEFKQWCHLQDTLVKASSYNKIYITPDLRAKFIKYIVDTQVNLDINTPDMIRNRLRKHSTNSNVYKILFIWEYVLGEILKHDVCERLHAEYLNKGIMYPLQRKSCVHEFMQAINITFGDKQHLRQLVFKHIMLYHINNNSSTKIINIHFEKELK